MSKSSQLASSPRWNFELTSATFTSNKSTPSMAKIPKANALTTLMMMAFDD